MEDADDLQVIARYRAIDQDMPAAPAAWRARHPALIPPSPADDVLGKFGEVSLERLDPLEGDHATMIEIVETDLDRLTQTLQPGSLLGPATLDEPQTGTKHVAAFWYRPDWTSASISAFWRSVKTTVQFGMVPFLPLPNACRHVMPARAVSVMQSSVADRAQ